MPARPATLSIAFEPRDRCSHAFSVPSVLSIFSIGGIIPMRVTCE